MPIRKDDKETSAKLYDYWRKTGGKIEVERMDPEDFINPRFEKAESTLDKIIRWFSKNDGIDLNEMERRFKK